MNAIDPYQMSLTTNLFPDLQHTLMNVGNRSMGIDGQLGLRRNQLAAANETQPSAH